MKLNLYYTGWYDPKFPTKTYVGTKTLLFRAAPILGYSSLIYSKEDWILAEK